MDQVYEAQVSLAQYFDTTKDFRLAEKMYEVAYKTSCQVRGDGRRKEAEANRNLAQTAERKKNYVKAKRLFEEFHSLSSNKNFQLPDGTSLHQVACECLQRVYIILSNQVSDLLPCFFILDWYRGMRIWPIHIYFHKSVLKPFRPDPGRREKIN